MYINYFSFFFVYIDDIYQYVIRATITVPA